MSRFTNDVDAVGEMMNNTMTQLISGAINIAGTLALMIYTNIYLTIITLVMAPPNTRSAPASAEKIVLTCMEISLIGLENCLE